MRGRLHGRVLNPQFTDLAIAVGPNVMWVEDDYADLSREHTVFLGYRVRLFTVREVAEGRTLRGLRPAKIVVFDGCQREREWRRAWEELHILSYGMSLDGLDVTTEYWHVHRGEGIWRIR